MSKEEKKNRQPNRETPKEGKRELNESSKIKDKFYSDKSGSESRRPTMETPIPPPPKKGN